MDAEQQDLMDDIFGPADTSAPDPETPEIRNVTVKQEEVNEPDEEGAEEAPEAELEGEVGEGEYEEAEAEAEGLEEDPEGEEEYITQDEYDELIEQNKQLLAQVNQQGVTMQQTGGFPGIQQHVQAQAPAPGIQQQQIQPQAQQQQVPPQGADQYLLSREELDRVLDDPTLINQAIQRVYNGVTQQTTAQTQQMQAAVDAQIQQAMWAKSVTDQFFSQNKDLRDPNLRQYVSNVAGNMMAQVQATGQQVNYEQVLDNAGDAVRKSLGIKKRSVSSKPARAARKGGARRRARKPSFASASSGRGRSKKAPQRNRQQSMMDEIM